jgi:hypothetical protein
MQIREANTSQVACLLNSQAMNFDVLDVCLYCFTFFLY